MGIKQASLARLQMVAGDKSLLRFYFVCTGFQFATEFI